MASNIKSKLQTFAARLGIGRVATSLAMHQDGLAQVNVLADDLQHNSDEDLRQQAQRIGERVYAGTALDDVAVQVFALVREVAHRKIGLRPYDVQILAGFGLHAGKIVQMQTGEGKTLAAVAPVVLHALQSKGVHVLTFNDYLARRDAEWMGPIYTFFGLRVGFVQQGMSPHERKAAYQADVTYVTAKEAGFDYLRDGLAFEPDAMVHRPFYMALVDEADSILIDEARIPLVIAGNTERSTGEPGQVAAIVRNLVAGQHYLIDRERETVHLTEAGIDSVEAALHCGNLFASENLSSLTQINAALYAHALMQLDVDYIIREGKVEIVDAFTGRVAENRHWPHGLQTAIEAKEGLRRTAEGNVLGQITLQHFLLQYPHLCGMTATAQVAADELLAVYGLEVQVATPNRPCIRVDHPDTLFTHTAAKQRAMIEEVTRVHATGRPILVGTLTVAESEQLATSLQATGVLCHVLNAKRDDEEARVVAQAGQLGAVTISTNMAGRGTDIRLGGADGLQEAQVIALGGLYVIGTHRHESLRVDDQLRGRAGRQGDPGSSHFFISLEDDLLQQSGVSDVIVARHLQRALQWEPLDDEALRHLILHAQRVVEGRNSDIRRGLWHFAHLLDQQRHIVYERRRHVLMRDGSSTLLRERAAEVYAQTNRLIGPAALADVERRLSLHAIDQCWADHLAAVAEMKEGIHLMSVGGLSPLHEFHKFVVKSFDGFFDRVTERAINEFVALNITAAGVDLDAAHLRGPSSTWTYLVEEEQYKDRFAAILIRQGGMNTRKARSTKSE